MSLGLIRINGFYNFGNIVSCNWNWRKCIRLFYFECCRNFICYVEQSALSNKKKLLNSQALSLKFEMDLLLRNVGIMQGVFLLLRFVFKSDQGGLGLVFKSISFFRNSQMFESFNFRRHILNSLENFKRLIISTILNIILFYFDHKLAF